MDRLERTLTDKPSGDDGSKQPAPAQPNARSIAAKVIERVLVDEAFAAAALDAELRRHPQLDQRERALATELSYGTLRAEPALRARLLVHAPRGVSDERVLAQLLVAAYQVLLLDRVPAFAAVDAALSHLERVPVPGQATSSRRRPPLVSKDAPDFVQRVTALLMAGKGDLLPVSAFPVDGTWPVGGEELYNYPHTGTGRWRARASTTNGLRENAGTTQEPLPLTTATYHSEYSYPRSDRTTCHGFTDQVGSKAGTLRTVVLPVVNANPREVPPGGQATPPTVDVLIQVTPLGVVDVRRTVADGGHDLVAGLGEQQLEPLPEQE